MWLNFSKLEILALKRLCAGTSTPGQLSEELGKKNSLISRMLNKLEEKGLVVREGRKVVLSPASHAQSFKKMLDSRPNAKIEEWLSGNSMSVLLTLADSKEGVEFKLLEEEAGCSKPTLFKVLKLLRAAGVVARTERTLISDRLLREFVVNYADAVQNKVLCEVKAHNFSVRVRKHVVVRTDAEEVPEFFSETGLTLLEKKGLEATRTSYNDYYFNLDRERRSIGTEEAFIHALLLTLLQQQQDKPILTVFLIKNARKLNMGKLRELARRYRVEEETVQLERELEILRNVAYQWRKA
ncbi:MAG: helix-turn-helix domain-containing protein [Candidatus Micrarchaeia archaeon]